MTQTTARQLIIGALIFTAMITGTFILIGNFLPENNNTNFNDDGGYNKSFNKFVEMNAESEKISNTMANSKTSNGPLGMINALIENSWGAVKQVYRSVTLMSTTINLIGFSFNIPGWVTILFGSIISITVTFAILAAIFKWDI